MLPIGHGYATQFSTLVKGNADIHLIFYFFCYNILYDLLYYLGYVLDIENRPIEGATITDESSSSVSKSYKNGSYNLLSGEGKLINYLILKTLLG